MMLLPLFIIFLLIVTFGRLQSSKKDMLSERQFWQNENSANGTRKKDISNLNYVNFSQVTLPFALFSDDLLTQCEQQIMNLKDKKSLNLTGISNTQLKLQYGAPNLPLLMQYDQNFTLLVRTLNQWGHRLFELSFEKEAEIVLSFAVSAGTDIKATYELLLQLYKASGETAKIENLKSSATQLNSLMKNPILAMLSAP